MFTNAVPYGAGKTVLYNTVQYSCTGCLHKLGDACVSATHPLSGYANGCRTPPDGGKVKYF
jgi:hypothetical protein